MRLNLCFLLGLVMLLALHPAARSQGTNPALPAPVAPQVKSLNPTKVKLEEKLTITGTNFSTSPKDNVVSIGEKQAQVQQASPTSIIVTVPKEAKAGKQKVTITLRGVKSNAVEVTVIGPPPELDSLSLTSASPGASLTISGKNFSTTAHENKVTIGGAQAEVHSASAGSLSVTIPASIESPQEASVTVQVDDQSAKNSLTIQIQSREY